MQTIGRARASEFQRFTSRRRDESRAHNLVTHHSLSLTDGRTFSGEISSEGRRCLRLLALDGGGIRALTQLFILKEIMGRIAYDLGLQELPPPCNYFDLIAGSGTGGLIAILLGRLNLTVDQAIDSYVALSESAFEKAGELQDREEAMRRTLEDVTQLDLGAPMCLVHQSCRTFVCTMFESNMAHAQRIRSYKVRANNGPECTIWEAIKASTGFPYFLEPVLVKDGHFEQRYVSASRAGYSNPLRLLMDEAHQIFPSHFSISCILNVGSGHPLTLSVPIENVPTHFLPSPLIQHSSPSVMINALQRITADCEAVAADFLAPADIFYRLSVDQGMQSIGISDWTRRSEVVAHVKSYTSLPSINKSIDSTVKAIISRTSSEWPLGSFAELGHGSNHVSAINIDPSDQEYPTIHTRDLLPCPNTFEICNGGTFTAYIAKHHSRFVVVKKYKGTDAKAKLKHDLTLHEDAMLHPGLAVIKGISSIACRQTFIVFGSERENPTDESNVSAMPKSVHCFLADELSQSSPLNGYLAGAKLMQSLSSAVSALSSVQFPFSTDNDCPSQINVFPWVDENENIVLSFGDSISSSTDVPEKKYRELTRAYFDLLVNEIIKTANGLLHDDERRKNDIKSLTDSRESALGSISEGVSRDVDREILDSDCANTDNEATAQLIKSRREYSYIEGQFVTLEQISLDYARVLERLRRQTSVPVLKMFSIHDSFGVPHRCQGYRREEVTLAQSAVDTAVVTFSTPTMSEKCLVCGRLIVVGVFCCPCGKHDDGFSPTVSCQMEGCIVWGHKRCYSAFQREHCHKTLELNGRVVPMEVGAESSGTSHNTSRLGQPLPVSCSRSPPISSFPNIGTGIDQQPLHPLFTHSPPDASDYISNTDMPSSPTNKRINNQEQTHKRKTSVDDKEDGPSLDMLSSFREGTPFIPPVNTPELHPLDIQPLNIPNSPVSVPSIKSPLINDQNDFLNTRVIPEVTPSTYGQDIIRPQPFNADYFDAQASGIVSDTTTPHTADTTSVQSSDIQDVSVMTGDSEWTGSLFAEYDEDDNMAVLASPAPVETVSSKPPKKMHKSPTTGTRKNVNLDTLLDVDTPLQTQKYAIRASTSRKEVPLTLARKRARVHGFDNEDELPPNATKKQQIEFKRLQNTLSARWSRKRKLERQRTLEDRPDGLMEEKDIPETRMSSSRPSRRQFARPPLGVSIDYNGYSNKASGTSIPYDAPTQPRNYAMPTHYAGLQPLPDSEPERPGSLSVPAQAAPSNARNGLTPLMGRPQHSQRVVLPPEQVGSHHHMQMPVGYPPFASASHAPNGWAHTFPRGEFVPGIPTDDPSAQAWNVLSPAGWGANLSPGGNAPGLADGTLPNDANPSLQGNQYNIGNNPNSPNGFFRQSQAHQELTKSEKLVTNQSQGTESTSPRMTGRSLGERDALSLLEDYVAPLSEDSLSHLSQTPVKKLSSGDHHN